MYKSMFLACMREKFGRMSAVYYLLPGIIAICVDATLSYSVLFVLELFTSVRTAGMFTSKNINCINSGYADFRRRRPGYILKLAFLTDIPWLFFMELKTLMSDPAMMGWVCVVWVYTAIAGILFGVFCQNELASCAVVIGCFFICIQKTLVHELYFRYISPVLIFRGELNVFNIIGMCLLSFFCVLALFMSEKKMRVAVVCLAIACFGGLTFCEMQYERRIADEGYVSVREGGRTIEYNPALDEERVRHAAEIIMETESCLNRYGFHFDEKTFRMEDTIYFPWESSRQKVFLSRDADVCRVNFYADSLYGISDEELAVRYIYSVLEQKTGLQEIAAELLADDVVSQALYGKRSDMLDRFSYESLTEEYGYCASPKQCAAAECMRLDAGSFAALYDAFGYVQELAEIKIEAVGASGAYEEMFGRITG